MIVFFCRHYLARLELFTNQEPLSINIDTPIVPKTSDLSNPEIVIWSEQTLLIQKRKYLAQMDKKHLKGVTSLWDGVG